MIEQLPLEVKQSAGNLGQLVPKLLRKATKLFGDPPVEGSIADDLVEEDCGTMALQVKDLARFRGILKVLLSLPHD